MSAEPLRPAFLPRFQDITPAAYTAAGTARLLIAVGAFVGHKAHVLVKADGLRVLLVDCDLPNAVVFRAVFQQPPADARASGCAAQQQDTPFAAACKPRRPAQIDRSMCLSRLQRAQKRADAVCRAAVYHEHKRLRIPRRLRARNVQHYRV